MPFDNYSSVVTRSSSTDTTYYFLSHNASPIEDMICAAKDDFTRSKHFMVASYAYIGMNYIEKDLEVASVPTWVTVDIERKSFATFGLSVNVDELISGQRSGTVVLRQLDSNKTLSFAVTQYGYENTISIIAEAVPGQKAYNLRLVASYPMIAGANVFRLRYMIVKNGMTSEEYALFTLLPGEKETSTMINGNGYSSYYLTRLVDVEAHSGDYYHYNYSFSYR